MDSKKMPIFIQVCEEFLFGVLKIEKIVAALKCHFLCLFETTVFAVDRLFRSVWIGFMWRWGRRRRDFQNWR